MKLLVRVGGGGGLFLYLFWNKVNFLLGWPKQRKQKEDPTNRAETNARIFANE